MRVSLPVRINRRSVRRAHGTRPYDCSAQLGSASGFWHMREPRQHVDTRQMSVHAMPQLRLPLSGLFALDDVTSLGRTPMSNADCLSPSPSALHHCCLAHSVRPIQLMPHISTCLCRYPVAARLGDALGVSPTKMSIVAMLGASAGFIVPYSYQTNLMVFAGETACKQHADSVTL